MHVFQPVYVEDLLTRGDPSGNVGIVTLWTPREKITASLDKKSFAVAGQLYSPTRGLDLLVRNLSANPQIRYLVITGSDWTGTGRVLSDFFANGVVEGIDSLGRKCWMVRSDLEGYIEIEVTLEALNTLRQGVTCISCSDPAELPELLQRLNSSGEHGPYASPQTFPKIETPPTFLPGENAVYVVRGNKVADTWIQILDTILKFGGISETHHGSAQKEILNLVSVISAEDPSNPYLPGFLMVTQDDLKQYIQQVLMPEVLPDVRYTYGERLRKHFGIDQIAVIVDKLVHELNTRNAVAVLWDPSKDNEFLGDKYISSPCINHIWVRVASHKLNLTAVIRSNDMYGAWPKNALSLRALQEEIRREVASRRGETIGLGDLVTTSQSAHIYTDCLRDAETIVQKQSKKVRDLAKNRRDERGNFVIEVRDGEIRVQHVTASTGEHIGFYFGKKAQNLHRSIAQDNVLSTHTHAIYLGAELQKAELALKYPDLFQYVQDQPLKRIN